MSLRLHSRYFTVRDADLAFRKHLLDAEEKHDLDIEAVVGMLLAIATETNKVESLKDRVSPGGLDPVSRDLYEKLMEIEEKYDLTVGETMKILLEAALNMNKYSIRLERHPNDPDKKGDEA